VGNVPPGTTPPNPFECTRLGESVTPVESGVVVGEAPTPTGGAIATGVYHVTEEIRYRPQGCEDIPSASTFRAARCEVTISHAFHPPAASRATGSVEECVALGRRADAVRQFGTAPALLETGERSARRACSSE
jgi:hypothetical protein